VKNKPVYVSAEWYLLEKRQEYLLEKRQVVLYLITKMVIELEIRPVIINLVKVGDRTRNGPLNYQTGNKICGYQSG